MAMYLLNYYFFFVAEITHSVFFFFTQCLHFNNVLFSYVKQPDENYCF